MSKRISRILVERSVNLIRPSKGLAGGHLQREISLPSALSGGLKFFLVFFVGGRFGC
jgi:hypothetical protein